MDHTRDPCPWVALNDFGGAFCMGVCSFKVDVHIPNLELTHLSIGHRWRIMAWRQG